jgi:two-component system, NarL family, nitrate/nitrite response regulator NarL
MKLGFLTKRETEVIIGVCEGLTNREIGERLEISSHTVKAYLFRLFRLFGVNSRLELIMKALEPDS